MEQIPSKVQILASIFIHNQTYKRSQIHDQYGGGRQGGISASAQSPYIFIFSSERGEQHGYKDGWENPDVYSYTGEGQVGDMRFIRGNLALKDHIKNGKRVFLFISIKKAFVRFVAELELIDFDYFFGVDKNGNNREAIKFFLKRKGAHLDYSVNKIELAPILEERKKSGYIDTPNETERSGLVISRVGQGAYRKSILYRWNFKCAVTSYGKLEILIASHIVPWKDATNSERLDVANGILLSPVYDALFDRHLISFENSGKILLSKSLSKTDYHFIGITGKEVIKKFSPENYPYLERHRQSLQS